MSYLFFRFTLLSLALGALPLVVHAELLTGEVIARKAFVASRVEDSTFDSTFHLVNHSGQMRKRKATGQTKLVSGATENRRLITFLGPSAVKGLTALMIEHSGKDDDVWVRLPAAPQGQYLSPSQKKDAFAETDFSYADLMGHPVENWIHRVVREEKVDGRDCWVVESKSRNPSVADSSGYSRRLEWLDKETYIMLKGEAFNLAQQLVKKFKAQKIEIVDAAHKKYQPMYLEAQSVQTGNKTIWEIKNFKANQGLSDEKFSAPYLEKQAL